MRRPEGMGRQLKFHSSRCIFQRAVKGGAMATGFHFASCIFLITALYLTTTGATGSSSSPAPDVSSGMTLADFTHEQIYEARVQGMSESQPEELGEYMYMHVPGPPVVINAVAPAGIAIDSQAGENETARDETEVIQLMNVGSEAINLRGWELRDGNDKSFVFGESKKKDDCPSDIVIEPGNTITLKQGEPCSYDFGLSAKDDLLNLFNPQGNKVDWTKWHLEGDYAGYIWARNPTGFGPFTTIDASNLPSFWKDLFNDDDNSKSRVGNSQTTAKEEDTDNGFQSSAPGAVTITEVSPKGDGDLPDWISITNSGFQPSDLRGWMLGNLDGDRFTFGYKQSSACPYPIVWPGQTMVFLSGTACSFDFDLSSKEESLQLISPEGIVKQNLSWKYDKLEEGSILIADPLEPNKVLVQKPQVNDEEQLFLSSNSTLMKPRLFISKIHASSLTNDWIELAVGDPSQGIAGVDDEPIQLSGYKLSEEKPSKSDKGTFVIGSEKQKECIPHLRNVTLNHGSPVVFVRDEPCSFSFGLKPKKGSLYLLDENDVIMDYVSWSDAALPDEEEVLLERGSRYSDQMLQVKSFDASVNGVTNRTENVVVKINEVVPKSSAHSDAIEIFNHGSEPVLLKGWYLVNTKIEEKGKVELNFADKGKVFMFGSGKCTPPIIQPDTMLVMLRDNPCSFEFGLSASGKDVHGMDQLVD